MEQSRRSRPGSAAAPTPDGPLRTAMAPAPATVVTDGVRRTVYAPPSSLSDDLEVLKAMWWHGPKSGGSHQDQLESFYERQAHLYDQYRHRMLHGRKPMMLNMPAPKDGVWVDLGGGTGANMEYFRVDDAIRNFSKVVLVDLTPSLAAIAQKRVEQHGWSDLVNVVCGDATDPKLEGLPAAGSVDVVTISYAITMIPNWQDAIDNALRLLKPGGRLCVCDFTVAPDQNPLMRAAFVKAFKGDHIYLSDKHIETLRAKTTQEQYMRDYGDFPYVPGCIRCPYYYYVGRKE